MRYRLTKKGKIVFTVLSVFLLLSVTGLVFGVRGIVNVFRDNPNATDSPPGESENVTMSNLSPSPSGETEPTQSSEPPSALPQPLESAEPSMTEAPSDLPTESETPSDKPSPPALPTTTPKPVASAEPPKPSTIPLTVAPSPSKQPPPVKDVYETQYLIQFDKNESELDKEELTRQLKSALSTGGTEFVVPKMESHYLVIQGYSDEGETQDIALKRSRFVRNVLRGMGMPDNKMLDMTAEDSDVESLSSVLLYFIQIGDK